MELYRRLPYLYGSTTELNPLDLVLQYFIDNWENKSLLFVSRMILFLVGLALGSRVSELFSRMS